MKNRHIPLHLLKEITVRMKHKDLIPGSSEVAIGLKVTDGRLWEPHDPEDERWNQDEKAFSEVKGCSYQGKANDMMVLKLQMF